MGKCLNIEIMIDQFENYLNNVYLITNDVKLHSSQYIISMGTCYGPTVKEMEN